MQLIAQNEGPDANLYQRAVGLPALVMKQNGPFSIGNASKGLAALGSVFFSTHKRSAQVLGRVAFRNIT
jgi:hypothetical protein